MKWLIMGILQSLRPASDLAKNTIYTAKITTDVTDASGNHLLNDYTWNFTTGTIDTVAPMVVSTIPAAVTVNPTDPDNPFGTSTNVPINDAITAYFSEGMDPSTINTNTFTLMQGTTPVAGTVTFDGYETAVFTPSDNLMPNTSVHCYHNNWSHLFRRQYASSEFRLGVYNWTSTNHRSDGSIYYPG